ncbi:Crp/Fnr family transcriptional regulator [Scytonema sp. NUACC21]
MPPAKNPSQPKQNYLLAALPPSEYQRLAPHLELIELLSHQILYEAHEPIKHIYFPNSGVISLVNTMENGSTIEVGVVSSEGIVGLAGILGRNIAIYQAQVQIPGDAMRIDAKILKTEFHQPGVLQTLLLRYCQMFLTQVSQSAACNRFHTVEERLARWLLLIQDLVGSEELPLTHEFLANMLGSRRSGVTVAAGTLQKAGMLRYSRGKITIVNREALEATTCECYGVISQEIAWLLGNKSPA